MWKHFGCHSIEKIAQEKIAQEDSDETGEYYTLEGDTDGNRHEHHSVLCTLWQCSTVRMSPVHTIS